MIDIKANFRHLFLLIRKTFYNQHLNINTIYTATTQYYQR